MNVLKIIGKVLLTILRVPFTIWYVVIGLILKFLSVFEKSGAGSVGGAFKQNGTDGRIYVFGTSYGGWLSADRVYGCLWN